jgi:hypothetical protein
VLRADGATVAETRENSISEQRIQGLERAMENQVQFPRRRKYLRPGQLAKLVDERKKSRISKEALGIKREAKDLSVRRRGLTIEVENVPTTNLSSPLSRSPVPTIQEWGPAYPQRKKLVAPRTPLTPACQLTVMRTPMREMDVPSQSESPLEGLPVELLVRLISLLWTAFVAYFFCIFDWIPVLNYSLFRDSEYLLFDAIKPSIMQTEVAWMMLHILTMCCVILCRFILSVDYTMTSSSPCFMSADLYNKR